MPEPLTMPSIGGHVAVVAAAGHHDVVVAHRDAVGRVEAEPALAAPDRHPGVARIRPAQARPARRRHGAQVAADIGGRQAHAAQARDHHVGEVLADPGPEREGLGERRVDGRGLGVEPEILADAQHQVVGRPVGAPARREARSGVVGDRGQQRHPAAREQEMHRRPPAEVAPGHHGVADPLPGQPGFRRRRDRALDPHGGERLDAEGGVGHLQGDRQRLDPEIVAPDHRRVGLGSIVTALASTLWPSPSCGLSRRVQRAKCTGLP